MLTWKIMRTSKDFSYIYIYMTCCVTKAPILSPNAIGILSRYLLDGKGKIITQTLSWHLLAFIKRKESWGTGTFSLTCKTFWIFYYSSFKIQLSKKHCYELQFLYPLTSDIVVQYLTCLAFWIMAFHFSFLLEWKLFYFVGSYLWRVDHCW